MSKYSQLNIGWGTADITPDRPVMVFGQLYTRMSQYVRDPLTVTAIALSNGEEQLVMLSADIAGFTPSMLERVRGLLTDLPGFDPRKLSVSAIHTHNSIEFAEGTDLFTLLFGKNYVPPEIQPIIERPDNILEGEEGLQFMANRVAAAVRQAWSAMKPGSIACASDYAAVAFNRRPVFDIGDGNVQSRMYGDCSENGFLRLEGPSDHTADMLYTFDEAGALTGIMVDIPCPSQVYELHCFLTADYWAPARAAIRERLGNIHILSLCGISGDQNPLDLVRLSKDNREAFKLWNAQASEVLRNFDMTRECELIGERICEAVMRGYRQARGYGNSQPAFVHKVIDMELPIRRVERSDYDEAVAALEREIKRFSPQNRMTDSDVVRVFEPCGAIARWEEQSVRPFHKFEIHIVRLGNAAIATNPFEPFVDYGMRIRARCKARQAFLVQLANGNFGYLPTERAVMGGGYSGKPASTPCGPDGGRELAERTIAEINALF